MSNPTAPAPAALESVHRELSELRERLEQLEDREDLRDLGTALEGCVSLNRIRGGTEAAFHTVWEGGGLMETRNLERRTRKGDQPASCPDCVKTFPRFF